MSTYPNIKITKKDPTSRANQQSQGFFDKLGNYLSFPKGKKSTSTAEWYYKVYPTDPNYDDREDKQGDWMKLVPEHSKAIEAFYQDCLNGDKDFGDTIVIHDKNHDWKYEISGRDQYPSSWTERNISLKNTKPRQLRRQEINVDQQSSFTKASSEEDQSYIIEGPQTEVDQLRNAINFYAANPQNYYCTFEIARDLVPKSTLDRIRRICIDTYRIIDI